MRPIDLLDAVRGNDYAIASVIFFCIGFRDEGAKGIIVSHLEEYRCGCLLQSFYEFGLDVEDYSSVPKSLLALFQLLLGIFDYDALWRSNRVLSPLLFVSFVVLVVFILMNIFLAIINDAFSVVNEQQRGSGSVSDMLRNLFMKKVLKKNVEEMLDDLAGGVNLHDKEGLAKALDMDGDNQLDAGEVRVPMLPPPPPPITTATATTATTSTSTTTTTTTTTTTRSLIHKTEPTRRDTQSR